MLWKKESQSPDALYIDLFASGIDAVSSLSNVLTQLNGQCPQPEKSNTIALQKRNEGNEKFRVRSYLNAMQLYSDSLCFAIPGSEHISLAYANRASCFLNLKMYENCLNDIELAIQAKYPQHLMPKLQDRRDKCLSEMQESHALQHESIFEPDDQIPYMLNAVKIERNEIGNLSLVAKTDIDVGQTIIVEDVFCIYPWGRYGAMCNICAKNNTNLVPCRKCTVAMFCSDCQGHFLHDYECGSDYCSEPTINRSVMHLVRTVLIALKVFATVDELMAFVEQIRKTPNNFPLKISDERSKYQAYFSCTTGTNQSMEAVKLTMYPAFKTLLRIKSVNKMFDSIEKRRFLMHLIGHHVTVPFDDDYTELKQLLNDFRSPEASISQFMRKVFGQSCNPNVLRINRDGKSTWISCKPIKQEDQLFFSNGPFEVSSTEKRQEDMWARFRLKCSCSRCQGEMLSTIQRQPLASDPTYRYIRTNVPNFRALNALGEVNPIMDKCVEFLQKYGRMDWCEEIGFVLYLFQILYYMRLGDGTNFGRT